MRSSSPQKFVYGSRYQLIELLQFALDKMQDGSTTDLGQAIANWKAYEWDDGSLCSARISLRHLLYHNSPSFWNLPLAKQIQLAEETKAYFEQNNVTLVISSKGGESIHYFHDNAM